MAAEGGLAPRAPRSDSAGSCGKIYTVTYTVARLRQPNVWIYNDFLRGSNDLLSYLFFDRCYAEHLIELGRRDAKAAEENLAAFLG